MKQVHLNDFVYSVEHNGEVAEWELRELVAYYPWGSDAYCVFKLDDGNSVSISSDGTIEEYDADCPRTFFLKYKDAAKEALAQVEDAIDYYVSQQKQLEDLVTLRNKLKEELKR
jgi:hypothetical protein